MTEQKKNPAQRLKVVRPATMSTTFNAVSARLRNLRLLHSVFAALYIVQLIIFITLAHGVSLPVTSSYLTKDPLRSAVQGSTVRAIATHHMFDVNVLYVIIVVFALAALAHIALATVYRSRYEAELAANRSTQRWIQYAIIPGLLLCLLGLVAGVQDSMLLLTIFIASAVLHMGCLLVERRSQPGEPVGKLLYGLGITTGLLPLVVIANSVLAAQRYGDSTPAYLYYLVGSSFVLFVASAANFVLQRRAVRWWTDYAFGERLFMLLSLVGTSSIAWQLFAGILH